MAKAKKLLSPKEELHKLRKQKIIPALRRASRWWPPKQENRKKQKAAPGKIECESCGDIFPEKEIKSDHITPVVDVKQGFVDWNDYVERMFCDANGFQCLCASCHDSKSAIENELRKKYRKKRLINKN